MANKYNPYANGQQCIFSSQTPYKCLYIVTSCNNWLKYQNIKWAKILNDHKNAFEKSESIQMKHVVLLTKKNE